MIYDSHGTREMIKQLTDKWTELVYFKNKIDVTEVHIDLINKNIIEIYNRFKQLPDDNPNNIKHFKLHMCLEYFLDNKQNNYIEDILQYYSIQQDNILYYSILHNIIGVCMEYDYGFTGDNRKLYINYLKWSKIYENNNIREISKIWGIVQTHYSFKRKRLDYNYVDAFNLNKIRDKAPLMIKQLIDMSIEQYNDYTLIKLNAVSDILNNEYKIATTVQQLSKLILRTGYTYRFKHILFELCFKMGVQFPCDAVEM